MNKKSEEQDVLSQPKDQRIDTFSQPDMKDLMNLAIELLQRPIQKIQSPLQIAQSTEEQLEKVFMNMQIEEDRFDQLQNKVQNYFECHCGKVYYKIRELIFHQKQQHSMDEKI